MGNDRRSNFHDKEVMARSGPIGLPVVTPWQQHVRAWLSCQQCELSNTRAHVVLARGQVPCDVLFIGEAPGESEDVHGIPFIGPAGKLLDRIVEKSLAGFEPLRKAYTNIVACYPPKHDGKHQPPLPEEIRACAPRLVEFVRIADPRMIVCVGGLAKDNLKKSVPAAYDGTLRRLCIIVDIAHPSSILHANVADRGLMVQRAVAQISTAAEELRER